MSPVILVLNRGSSSLKGTLFRLPDGPLPVHPPEPLWSDQGESELALAKLWQGPDAVVSGPEAITAVGHRIVHGGNEFHEPVRLTPDVRSKLAGLAEIAPEHNRRALETIEQTEGIMGSQVPQFAVFDTAFHSTLPRPAYTYGGPYEWLDRGIRRYGFHGLSYSYALRRTAEMLGRPAEHLNLVLCHLGNGCSVAAVRNGISVDTSMGFTPLEGLIMGSRAGSMDPAILLHLERHRGLTADEIDRILNKESGLKGLSGISSDMREIEEKRAQGDERASLAFDCFIHALRRHIGAMLASTGQPDAFVFTGGIGEHSSEVRSAVCSAFAFTGVEIDPQKNAHPELDADISASSARVRVLVLKAQEDWEIAQNVQRALADSPR